MSYFLAFLAFCALIILHEAGHFTAAKAVGMRVEKFCLFFGPMVVKKRIGETVYGVGTIPLGGFVKITGMSEVEFAGIEFVDAHEEEDVKRRAYYNQPVWKRIVVIAAGPAVNLLIAFIIVWCLVLGTNHDATNRHGQPIVSNNVQTIYQKANRSDRFTTAAWGKLKPGDRIVAVDGVRGDSAVIRRQIESDTCAHHAQVNGCQGERLITMLVRRDGKLVTVRLRPRYDKQAGAMLVGFAFAYKTVKSGPGYSVSRSATWLWQGTEATISHFAKLFEAKDRRQVQGVVGAYYVTTRYIQEGPSAGLAIIALISWSLGLINLFPFLPLDGGHIFWALIEKLRRKRVSIATMERASIVGIVLILGLFALGMVNSIHLISSHKI